MAEYSRVVSFEADDEAIDALVGEIERAGGAPDGVNASRITVLADRGAGTLVVAIRFRSEADLRAGSAVLEAMSPSGPGTIRRTSVSEYEVLLEREGS